MKLHGVCAVRRSRAGAPRCATASSSAAGAGQWRATRVGATAMRRGGTAAASRGRSAVVSVRADASERWRYSAERDGGDSGGDGSATPAAAASTAAGGGAIPSTLLTVDGKKRVVVTGMGVVTAHGNDVDTFYDKLLAGESSITKISEWEPHEDFATIIAGEIKARVLDAILPRLVSFSLYVLLHSSESQKPQTDSRPWEEFSSS